jgi:hypothetical protein
MFSNQQKNDRILSLFATFFNVVASKIISSKFITEFYKNMHEPELFETYYEINKPHTSPTFWKIVGATLAIHLVAFITLSQVNLLQTKACDSPYVGKVCEVLDAAYVGSVFLGTDRTSVDAPYEKTELDDADITFIDVSNTEPDFKYPEGYFEPEIIENDLAVVDPNGNPIINSANGTIPGIPGFPNAANPTIGNPTLPAQNLPNVNSFGKSKGGFSGGGFGKNAKLPPANPNSLTGTIPDSPIADSGKSKVKNNTPKVISKAEKPTPTPLQNESPKELPKFGKDNGKPQIDKKQDSPETANNEIIINRKPLKDFKKEVKLNWEILKASFDKPFQVGLNGKLKADGKLDPKTISSSSVGEDEELTKAIAKGILAFNDCGYLQYLEKLSGKTLKLVVTQENGKLVAQAVAEMESPLRANTTTGLLKLALQFGKSKKETDINDPKNTNIQNDKDELMLLQKAVVKTDGKKVVIEFEFPSDFAKSFLERKINEVDKEEDTAATKTPNSQVVSTKNANTNTVK